MRRRVADILATGSAAGGTRPRPGGRSRAGPLVRDRREGAALAVIALAGLIGAGALASSLLPAAPTTPVASSAGASTTAAAPSSTLPPTASPTTSARPTTSAAPSADPTAPPTPVPTPRTVGSVTFDHIPTRLREGCTDEGTSRLYGDVDWYQCVTSSWEVDVFRFTSLAKMRAMYSDWIVAQHSLTRDSGTCGSSVRSETFWFYRDDPRKVVRGRYACYTDRFQDFPGTVVFTCDRSLLLAEIHRATIQKSDGLFNVLGLDPFCPR